VHFVTPVGGTSTGVDAIAMFRGAPHPAVAHAFLEYVLSPDGQALWNQRPGTPNGPRRRSLRRLPVRKDMYTPEKLPYFADPEVLPYAQADAFTYTPAWTANRFAALRLGVRVMCIDTHDELTAAWKDLIAADFPPLATEQFGAMGQLAADPEGITTQLASNDKLIQVKLARTPVPPVLRTLASQGQKCPVKTTAPTSVRILDFQDPWLGGTSRYRQ
jgi:hypothetical protein